MVLSKLDPLTIKFFLIQKATEKKKKKEHHTSLQEETTGSNFSFSKKKKFQTNLRDHLPLLALRSARLLQNSVWISNVSQKPTVQN